jgi:hypothetical protein
MIWVKKIGIAVCLIGLQVVCYADGAERLEKSATFFLGFLFCLGVFGFADIEAE